MKEVGRQHQRMVRSAVQQVPEGSEKQGKLQKTGCQVNSGAPATRMVLLATWTCWVDLKTSKAPVSEVREGGGHSPKPYVASERRRHHQAHTVLKYRESTVASRQTITSPTKRNRHSETDSELKEQLTID